MALIALKYFLHAPANTDRCVRGPWTRKHAEALVNTPSFSTDASTVALYTTNAAPLLNLGSC